MIIGSKTQQAWIEITEPCCFLVYINDHEYTPMDRQRLTEFRSIIDQALNTSAEELGDDLA